MNARLDARGLAWEIERPVLARPVSFYFYYLSVGILLFLQHFLGHKLAEYLIRTP